MNTENNPQSLWASRLFLRVSRIERGLLEKGALVMRSEWICWLLIGLGIALRLASYLHNRSFWRDEAALALNIIERSFAGLLQPLDYNQAAPPGFLMVERLAVVAFGSSEYSLRLVSLLAGVTSLFLFKRVASQCLKPLIATVALAFFALSPKLIYHSSDVKQYSIDVAVVLALSLIGFDIKSKGLSAKRAIWFGLAGAVAVWFSHPSIFVLAGVGATLSSVYLLKKDWKNGALMAVACLLWVASFAGHYFVSLRETSNSDFLLKFWSDYDAFMPFPPLSLSDASWFSKSFFLTFEDPAGFSLSVLAALVFIIGCISAFVGKKARLMLMLTPLPFALLASGLHAYPLLERLLLFLVPSLLLFIAEGLHRVGSLSVTIGVVLGAVLFFHPASDSIAAAPLHEDVKPALSYIKEHWREGDLLYVHYIARKPFMYYAERYGLSEGDYIKGSRKWGNKLSDTLEDLRGSKRVWVLFYVFYEKEMEYEKSSLTYLDSVGARMDSFRDSGTAVYLYDLSVKP